MAKIVAIEKGSLAEELGLEVGDQLVGFNNKLLVDILDYYYYDSQEKFVMNIVAKQGQLVDLDIEKYEYEQIGLELDDSLDLEPIRCKNKCIFCFIDQMPKGMRDSLYVKDDDYRLSFASGNYVTLTNCLKDELDRIAMLKLSPLYISVHCFDPATKIKMIANPEGAKLFEKMTFLADNGINMHAQIVLCKGINDGKILEQTLSELYKLMPHILSVAIIPVGLTSYREGLFPLEVIDQKTAMDVINIVQSFDKKVGGGWCWCADEMYLIAQKSLGNYDSYGDFGQIEDGIGLCTSFCQSFEEALQQVKLCKKHCELSLITGQAFKGTLTKLIEKAKEKFINLSVDIVAIENNFFGKTITVAGLVTATDIIDQTKNVYKNVLIPSNMLRQFTDTFLDGKTVSDVENALNCKVFVGSDGCDIISTIVQCAKSKNICR